MATPKADAETRPQVDGPIEPKPIMFIGGPMNAKKIADKGQTVWHNGQGDEYRRVRMDAGDALGRMTFDILAYWGKTWEHGIDNGAR